MLTLRPRESWRTATILVIEDDGLFRRFLRRLLERMGFTVLTAAGGRRGVDIFRRERPDVVLTDILMPDQDGIETLLAIRREASAAKVIVMSGHRSRLDYLRLAKQLGASDVLRKPFSPDDLAAAIYRCLGPTAVPHRMSRTTALPLRAIH